MWRLVPALTLLGAALVTALPAAQQDSGDLSSLIKEAFPEIYSTTQSVSQIGGDLDSLIKDVFQNGNASTTTPPGLILGSQNQQKPKPSDCECVPYYQCKDNKILETGIGIIDIRSGFGNDDGQAQG